MMVWQSTWLRDQLDGVGAATIIARGTAVGDVVLFRSGLCVLC